MYGSYRLLDKDFRFVIDLLLILYQFTSFLMIFNDYQIYQNIIESKKESKR